MGKRQQVLQAVQARSSWWCVFQKLVPSPAGDGIASKVYYQKYTSFWIQLNGAHVCSLKHILSLYSLKLSPRLRNVCFTYVCPGGTRARTFPETRGLHGTPFTVLSHHPAQLCQNHNVVMSRTLVGPGLMGRPGPRPWLEPVSLILTSKLVLVTCLELLVMWLHLPAGW